MSTEERVARLEKGYTHLATRGDMLHAGRELKVEVDALCGEIQALANSLKVWLVVAVIIQDGINALIMQVV